MTRVVLDSLRRISPGAAPGPDGVPRAIPASIDEAAQVLGVASEQGWRVRLEGAGTWCPPDAPAEISLATTRLTRIVRVAPDDLVLTAQAGVPMARLRDAGAAHGTRLPVDPPGDRARTLGSVLATATTGPGRQGDGPVRDHVLGLTLVTGDGRTLRTGGSVVKNVAGYDVPKLAVGGFGAFGLIVEAHLRLRAAPAARAVLAATGPFDALFEAGLALGRGGGELAALELVSPAVRDTADWSLFATVIGSEAAVTSMTDRIPAEASSLAWHRSDPAVADHLAGAIAAAAVADAVTLRFGVFPDSIPGLLELLEASVGTARFVAGPGRGGARWTGTATAAQIGELRRRLAIQEIPVTVERGPWPVRSAAGCFGAYREGVARLATRLRAVFDPQGTLVVPLDGAAS